VLLGCSLLFIGGNAVLGLSASNSAQLPLSAVLVAMEKLGTLDAKLKAFCKAFDVKLLASLMANPRYPLAACPATRRGLTNSRTATPSTAW
jgi:hypothetical protein